MSTGVVLLNFGEPPTADREAVVDYLERIFYSNMDIEEDPDLTPEAARKRAGKLAERRAPGLIEEYEEIGGGSPLNEQASAQADALETELRDRGYDVATYTGMLYTEPFTDEAAERAVADGHDEVLGLPIYPLCGPSTTNLSLDHLADGLDSAGFDGELHEVSGWHRHPTYNRLRAENIREYAEREGVDLHDEDTVLFFSAHGTPRYYLDEGSRYDRYVEEWCAGMAGILGLEDYELGFQNHDNRSEVAWTEPDVEEAIESLDAERVVVEPVSFMHEQSETLSELDIELREEAEEAGIEEFYRVPIPHDDDRFPSVLADLAEPFLADFDPGYFQFRQCHCRDKPGTMCLNAPDPDWE
ncbi:ferrochelatase [Halapricum desulfuricans]|uniref:Ferrochelatase n=1 Tax=Halapricum desulfuricans TaxID=2841257 RepID=A0A897NB31_9EURY|nr:ferrochelatase [Halapricum desulfuricans]QSG09618.1 Protoheme ferro-lyase [Halapricum desulfuricans]